jgi:hypothetical protein
MQDNRTKINEVFQILYKQHLITRSELPVDLQNNETIIELLKRFSPEVVAEIIMEEINFE